MDGLELFHFELLVDDSHLEVNAIGGRQIDLDLVHIEPKQKPLHLDSIQVGDRPVTELASDGLLVVDQVLELNVARFLQMDDESAIVGQSIARNRVRQEPTWETKLGEDFEDRGGVRER